MNGPSVLRSRSVRAARPPLLGACLALLLGAGLPLATACASAGGGGAGEPAGPVHVEVTNNSTETIVVYAIYGSQSTRLGELSGLGSATLRLPPLLDRGGIRIRFVIDAIGSAQTSYRSQELFLSPGDVVVIRVQPNLRQTSVFVR